MSTMLHGLGKEGDETHCDPEREPRPKAPIVLQWMIIDTAE